MLRSSVLLAGCRLPAFSFSMQLGNQFELDPSIPNYLKQSDFIQPRFIGPSESDKLEMLKVCKSTSMAEFLDKVLPKEIRWENHIN